MKKVQITLYVGAALYALYALANFAMGFGSYAEYIEYYGFAQVFPTIAELLFGSLGWAFLLLGLGAICGHFARQEAILSSIDLEEEEADEGAEMVPEADQVEEAADSEAAEEAAEDQEAEEKADDEAAEAPAPEKEQA